MRPIDADALSAKMYHDAFETDSDMQKWDSGCWIRYKMFEKNLEDAPTIEQPTVAYLCDKTKCGEKCSAMEGICNHTFDVRHAVNFIEIHGVFVEDGDA